MMTWAKKLTVAIISTVMAGLTLAVCLFCLDMPPAAKEINNSGPQKNQTPANYQEIKQNNQVAIPARVAPTLPAASSVTLSKLAPAKKTVSMPDPKSLKPAVAKPMPAASQDLTRAGVILQTNKQRLANAAGDLPLRENALLDKAAESKIDDMFSKQYFDHVSPTGAGPGEIVERAGYEFIIFGENLAMGDYDGDTALVQAWMDSPGHRANILKPGYREIGVAVRQGNFNGQLTWLAVQEFGAPKSACPAVDDSLSARIDADKTALDRLNSSQETRSQDIDAQNYRLQAMEDDLNSLVSNGASSDEILARQQEINDAIAQANNDVNSYNDANRQAISLYNNYKSETDEYNSQVQSFNACLATFN